MMELSEILKIAETKKLDARAKREAIILAEKECKFKDLRKGIKEVFEELDSNYDVFSNEALEKAVLDNKTSLSFQISDKTISYLNKNPIDSLDAKSAS